MTNRQDLSSYSVTLRALGAILCLVIPPISSAAVAQQGHPKPTNPTDKEPVTQQLDESAALRRRLAVDGFANRILAFQNLPLKVSALVRLADSVWRHDEVYARKLFDRALDLCVLKQDVSQREVQEIRSLRRKVIASIARR